MFMNIYEHQWNDRRCLIPFNVNIMCSCQHILTYTYSDTRTRVRTHTHIFFAGIYLINSVLGFDRYTGDWQTAYFITQSAYIWIEMKSLRGTRYFFKINLCLPPRVRWPVQSVRQSVSRLGPSIVLISRLQYSTFVCAGQITPSLPTVNADTTNASYEHFEARSWHGERPSHHQQLLHHSSWL